METQGVSGQRYIYTLINEYSRFTMLRTISSRAEASAALIDMITAIETQTGHQAKTIKTDNGGEYRSAELLQYLRTKGISLKETVLYHSQTNAVAERTNRTLVTMARTALLHAKLPKNLWPEAVAHAAYTKNRTPPNIVWQISCRAPPSPDRRPAAEV
jgi:transposase InsO family protein